MKNAVKQLSLVTTTINVPEFLDSILANMSKTKAYNIEEIDVRVIGDKKTPLSAKDYCNSVENRFGISVKYFDVEHQERELKVRYPLLWKMFPYNDAVRKLLGSLDLFGKMSKRVFFLDDDNYSISSQDICNELLIVGNKYSGPVVSANHKWPNVYENFIEAKNIPIFPRGYPWKYRHRQYEGLDVDIVSNKKVIANCGYILNDPDIDAVSRLFYGIQTLGMKNQHHLVIQEGNFCPLNDQNLCLDEAYVPLYFKPVSGGRNSDIWTSYLLEKVASHFGELVSYGKPYLTQVRNSHDYWNDFELEKAHNIATDQFATLMEIISIPNECNDRNQTFKFVCRESIRICEEEIQVCNVKKTKSVENRHYQNLNAGNLAERHINSLQLIIEYFAEYEKWLGLVEKIEMR